MLLVVINDEGPKVEESGQQRACDVPASAPARSNAVESRYAQLLAEESTA